MRCGLFGKLPAKRDFVAVNTTSPFLRTWEVWMQAAISASRQSLGQEWQAAYLKAPIWRFWLGEELCGSAVIGAFMPSLDGIGRYFPLTAFACSDEGGSIAPPELAPQDTWFAALETFLLSTLEEDCTYEATTAALAALPAPEGQPPSVRDGILDVPEGLIGTFGAERDLKETLSTMRLLDHARTYSSMTYWWTIGGEDYRPLVMAERKMPDPFLFGEMLTGRFAFGFE